jgi:hypothetical protein
VAFTVIGNVPGVEPLPAVTKIVALVPVTGASGTATVRPGVGVGTASVTPPAKPPVRVIVTAACPALAPCVTVTGATATEKPCAGCAA